MESFWEEICGNRLGSSRGAIQQALEADSPVRGSFGWLNGLAAEA